MSLSFAHPQLVGDPKILGRWRNSCCFLMHLLSGVASYIPPAAKSSLETGEQLRDAGRGDAAQPPLPPAALPPALPLLLHGSHAATLSQSHHSRTTEQPRHRGKGLMPAQPFQHQIWVQMFLQTRTATQPHSGCLWCRAGCELRAEGALGEVGVLLRWGLMAGSAAQPDLLSQAVQSHQPQRQHGVSFLLCHIQMSSYKLALGSRPGLLCVTTSKRWLSPPSPPASLAAFEWVPSFPYPFPKNSRHISAKRRIY